MELPHDIEERLERRFSRHIQEMEIRHQKKVVNETEVTEKKVENQPAAEQLISTQTLLRPLVCNASE
jgi:hypothetical protein